MPSLELNFLPRDKEVTPTDEQLLLTLVYGLCGQITDPREENSRFFISAVAVPVPDVRRLAKLLVTHLNLPIPPERVDEWIEWQQTNQCWVVNEEMSQKTKRLSTLIAS